MKAAIIGLGWQGKRHYEALKELGIELACIIDVKPDVVKEKFPEIPHERISDDPKILKKFKPDAAIISTNASQRLNILRYCLEAGIKKVFCEKPMAATLGDALEMARLAKEAGCLLSINHLRRFNPNYMKLMETIDSGVIGKVEHLYAQAGSVGLGNEGTHIVDKMRMVAGNSDIDWVIGFTDKTGTPNPRGPQYSDPAGWGMMLLKDGTRAFIDTCEDTGVPSVFEIAGTYGRIIIRELHNDWKIFARAKEERDVPLTKLLTPLHEMPAFETRPWDVKEFTRNGLKELLLENKVMCTAQDGCKALEAMVAFHVSDSLGGAKVSLPLDKKYRSWEVNWA